MIEQAMDVNSDFVLVGCALIQGFLWRHDREDEAEAFYRRANEHERIVVLAALERRRIHQRDCVIETGLDDPTIAPIREELSKCPEVARAYLVRKEVIYFPEKFLFVLGFVPRLDTALHARAHALR
jgi:hypothetical protein